MVEKCCYFIPMDTGALFLGVLTLILSVIMSIYSVALLGLENTSPLMGAHHLKLLTHLEFDSKSVKVVLCIIITAQILWMMFSILLIIGIKKNRPQFLLCYFSFGIVMAILMMLVGLLVLLKQHWIMSLIQFIAAAVYIHGLIVVYHGYETMQRLDENSQDDEHQLWRPDDDEIEVTA